MHSHLLHLHSVQGFVYRRFRGGFLYWQGWLESLKASELLQGHHRKLGLACHTLVTLRRLHYIRQLCHPKDSEISEGKPKENLRRKVCRFASKTPTGMTNFPLRLLTNSIIRGRRKWKHFFLHSGWLLRRHNIANYVYYILINRWVDSGLNKSRHKSSPPYPQKIPTSRQI